MSEDKKHGLYKVVAQADKLARIVMDQLAKDGCGNLENIRDAMLPVLVAIEREKEDARRASWMGYDLARPEAMRREIRRINPVIGGLQALLDECDDKADAIQIGVDSAKFEGDQTFYTYVGQFWEMRHGPNGPEGRRAVRATHSLLRALGDAIATQKAQRVSIDQGTYVMPDGEVLSELEMIKRSGTDGR